jgi:membrane associated rhomboid family serine protease
MVRFLKIAFVALAGVVLLGFAFANRHLVTVSFDPFASIDNAALSIEAPLFSVAIVAAMLGVVAGAFATWLSQGRHRRASRQSRLEADKWRAQAESLKAARPPETPRPALPRDR